MRVWRVENEAGDGAYQILDPNATDDADYYDRRILNPAWQSDRTKHPTPYSDPILKWRWCVNDDLSEYVLGFTNERAYHAWFDDSLKERIRPYCKLSIYEVLPAAVIVGMKQCVFDPVYAQLVGRFDI